MSSKQERKAARQEGSRPFIVMQRRMAMSGVGRSAERRDGMEAGLYADKSFLNLHRSRVQQAKMMDMQLSTQEA